jgi:hypothetical protein
MEVSIPVAGSVLAEGFHVVRIEIVPPAGGEITTRNNAVTTVVQVGWPPVPDAILGVTASANWGCGDGMLYVSGNADYFIASDTGNVLSSPVKGGMVTAEIWDGAGTTLIWRFPLTHTDTSGRFQQALGAPPAGEYQVRVEVTDSSLTGRDVTTPQDCQGPPPPPSGGLDVDLSVCSGDIRFFERDCVTDLVRIPAPGEEVCIQATINNLGQDSARQLLRNGANRDPAHQLEGTG